MELNHSICTGDNVFFFPIVFVLVVLTCIQILPNKPKEKISKLQKEKRKCLKSLTALIYDHLTTVGKSSKVKFNLQIISFYLWQHG